MAKVNVSDLKEQTLFVGEIVRLGEISFDLKITVKKATICKYIIFSIYFMTIKCTWISFIIYYRLYISYKNREN